MKRVKVKGNEILLQKSKTKYRIKVPKLKTRKYVNFNNILKGPLFDKVCLHVKLLWSCSTLCDPMDCRPPGASVHGILQARILE